MKIVVTGVFLILVKNYFRLSFRRHVLNYKNREKY